MLHNSRFPRSTRVSGYLAAFVLLAVHASAQCRVEGIVRITGGAPLASATVRLESSEYKRPLITTTDADGYYAFDEVKPGIRVRVVALQNNRAVAQASSLVTQWVETVDLQEQIVPIDPGSPEYIVATDGPSGTVAGTVLDADGRALAAARIRVGDTTLTTTTDSAGRYTFGRLRPDVTIDLHASASGYQTASQSITVVANSRLGINFSLAPASAERMTPPMATLEQSADGSRATFRPEQVAGVPSIVRNDLFRALQFLPGVAASARDTSELYVRGGTPDQTLVTVDGFNLYQFADPLSAFSAYNMDTVEQADFSTAPSDAGGGGRLSSALRLNGRALSGRAWSGFADVSALGLNTLVNASIANRVSVLVAGRWSAPTSLYDDVLDQFLPTGGTAVRDRLPRFTGGSLTATGSTSDFHDVNAKVHVKASDRDRVSFSIYDGHTNLNASHDLSLPDAPVTAVSIPATTQLPADAVLQVDQTGSWTSHGAGGRWQHRWSPSASTEVSLGRSEYIRLGNQARLLTGTSTGGDYSFADERGGSDALTESNHLTETTVRGAGDISIGFAHSLSVGAEWSSIDVAYSAQTETFHQTSGTTPVSGLSDLLNTTASGMLTSIYAQDAWRPVTGLIVAPGLRVVHYDRTASSYLEPRLNASYQVLPMLRIKGGFSVDHQVINRITREDRLRGDGAFWMLSDGSTVPVPSAVQAVVGAALELNGVLVTVDAYAKQLDDLTLFAPRLYPGVAAQPGQTLFYTGTGTSRGIEGLVHYKVPRNAFWAGYTLSKTEDNYPALEATAFPTSFDRRHEFKAVDVIQLFGTWSVSGAWIAASGRPYTPATGLEQVWFPSGATVYEVTFDGKNSARLPFYNRFDVASQKDFVTRGITSSVGGTILNILDRQNLSPYEYDTAGQTLNGYDVPMMGRTFNLFFRVGF